MPPRRTPPHGGAGRRSAWRTAAPKEDALRPPPRWRRGRAVGRPLPPVGIS